MYKKIVEDYSKTWNKEDLSLIYSQLYDKNDAELIDRKNFIGHFTASAFVVYQKEMKILLLDHNFFKMFLQPGGHIEKEDMNPINAAKRELIEETGIIDEDIEYIPANPLDDITPLNINIHPVPENIAKNEKEHYHYDLQYLFLCNKQLNININLKESSNYKWLDWNTFKEIPWFNIAEKIEDIIKERR